MFKHIFKLIWNKKKQNFLLITEMFDSFIVMFAVFTLMVYYYQNYKKPTGFDYNDVWVVNYTAPENIQSTDSIRLFQETLTKMLTSMPQIQASSFTSFNVPFSMSTANTEVSNGDIMHIRSNIYHGETSYKDVLNFQMLQGRWFSDADDVAGKYVPVVINEKLKEDLFGNEDAIGKIIKEEQFGDLPVASPYRVIGVANNMKDKSEYQAIEGGMYLKMDTGAMRWGGNILLKVRPGTDASFEAKLFKSVSNAVGSSVEIEHLDKKLVTKNKVMIVPLIIALIVVGF